MSRLDVCDIAIPEMRWHGSTKDEVALQYQRSRGVLIVRDINELASQKVNGLLRTNILIMYQCWITCLNSMDTGSCMSTEANITFTRIAGNCLILVCQFIGWSQNERSRWQGCNIKIVKPLVKPWPANLVVEKMLIKGSYFYIRIINGLNHVGRHLWHHSSSK